ncbi:MAG: hypothetical protein NTX24_03660 [Candidatus Pacearchaeota archaeon]|nr:hypothetical protein [Candidatus Pacearchaeota archaeon]
MPKQMPLYEKKQIGTLVMENADRLPDYKAYVNSLSGQGFSKKALQILREPRSVDGDFGKTSLLSNVCFYMAFPKLVPAKVAPENMKGNNNLDVLIDEMYRGTDFNGAFTFRFGVVLNPTPDAYRGNGRIPEELCRELGLRGISICGGKLIYLKALKLVPGDSEYGLVLSLKDMSGRELQEKNLVIDPADFHFKGKRVGISTASVYVNIGRCESDLEGRRHLNRFDETDRICSSVCHHCDYSFAKTHWVGGQGDFGCLVEVKLDNVMDHGKILSKVTKTK